jgi:hypothetical protein
LWTKSGKPSEQLWKIRGTNGEHRFRRLFNLIVLIFFFFLNYRFWASQLHSLLSELLIQQQQQNQLHLQQSVEVLQAEHERTRNVISDSMAAVVHDTRYIFSCFFLFFVSSNVTFWLFVYVFSVSLAEALGETISANSNQHVHLSHIPPQFKLLPVLDFHFCFYLFDLPTVGNTDCESSQHVRGIIVCV